MVNTTSPLFDQSEMSDFQAAGDLVLRVCGSTRDGQIVRLRSGKCSIGSAAQCTLRLCTAGVQPMHCLIVRGSECTVIRRWSPDTRLNGRDFTDSILTPGDRLGFGPIELEVVDPGRLPAGTLAAGGAVDDGSAEDGVSCQENGEVDSSGLRQAVANRQARQRVRRLVAELRSARKETEMLQARLSGQSGRQPEDGHPADTPPVDLAEQLDAFRIEQREWQQAMERREESFRQQQARWEVKRDEWESERIAYQAERKAQEAAMAEREEEIRRQRDLLDAEQAELEALHSAHEAEHREQEAALIAREAELQRQQEELDADPGRRAESRQGPPKEETDVADIFRRMGSVPTEQDRETCVSQEPPAPRPAQAKPAFMPQGNGSLKDESDEESIAEYMAKLMSRVQNIRGDVPGDENTAPSRAEKRPKPAVVPRSPAQTNRAIRASQPKVPAAPSRVEPTKDDAGAAPRARVPEQRDKLSAMRDVANFSARTAIQSHAQRKECKASCAKILVMAVAVVSGSVLLRMWWVGRTGSTEFFASLVAFLIASRWGAQGIRMKIRKFRGLPTPCDEVDESSPAESGRCPVPATDAAPEAETRPDASPHAASSQS